MEPACWSVRKWGLSLEFRTKSDNRWGDSIKVTQHQGLLTPGLGKTTCNQDSETRGSPPWALTSGRRRRAGQAGRARAARGIPGRPGPRSPPRRRGTGRPARCPWPPHRAAAGPPCRGSASRSSREGWLSPEGHPCPRIKGQGEAGHPGMWHRLGLPASPGAPAIWGKTRFSGTVGKAHLGREEGVTGHPAQPPCLPR